MENIELSYILNGKLEKTGFQVGEEGEFRSKDGFFILKSRSLVNRFQGQHISLSLHFSGQNPGASSLELETLKVDIKAPRLQSALVFQQGYQSWSFSVAYQHTERDLSPALEFLRYNEENVYTHHSGKFGDFQTEGFMALYSEKDKKGLLVGASSADGPNQTYRVLYKPNGEIHSLSVSFGLYCNREVNVNAKLDLGSLDTYEFKISPEEALENFARFSSEKYARPTREMPTPRGWCSWYYYYTEINEDVILNNLRLLQEKQPGLEFFQIDDGYQKEIGDWLLFNERFPNGLKPIVEEIKKTGMKPGLWLAPFLIRKKSEFFQTYPEAVLRDTKGNPVPALWNPLWGWDYTYTMDASHPRALEFLEHVFDVLVNELGFVYLKLDFLYSASLIGEAFDKSLHPASRYRNALKRIRKVVGEEVFLLGCGAPLVPSYGIFDGMRIGCDVAPFWYPEWFRKLANDKHALCTEKALVNTLTRSFHHRNHWLNDPDCLLVRKDKNFMTEKQTILMATIMAMSGGMLLISDNMETIANSRLVILQKAIELSKACEKKKSIPLGIFESKFPKGFYNPAGFLGIWNPERTEKVIELNLPEEIPLSVFRDYWTEKKISEISIKGKKLHANLSAFQTYVFQF